MFTRFAILAGALLTTGCAELGTSLMYLDDAMAMEQGAYWDDVHYSDTLSGDKGCPYRVDYGIVNNQAYVRIVNMTDYDREFVIVYNSGLETPVYLGGGEASEFFYTSPSVHLSSTRFDC
ncbi:MAG: hypothetical protein KGS00_07385 [Alphaproteobacteria bacterium]|nr:hypothetical protein [Alphaproteobacteria bacterium]